MQTGTRKKDKTAALREL